MLNLQMMTLGIEGSMMVQLVSHMEKGSSTER